MGLNPCTRSERRFAAVVGPRLITLSVLNLLPDLEVEAEVDVKFDKAAASLAPAGGPILHARKQIIQKLMLITVLSESSDFQRPLNPTQPQTSPAFACTAHQLPTSAPRS